MASRREISAVELYDYDIKVPTLGLADEYIEASLDGIRRLYPNSRAIGYSL